MVGAASLPSVFCRLHVVLDVAIALGAVALDACLASRAAAAGINPVASARCAEQSC